MKLFPFAVRLIINGLPETLIVESSQFTAAIESMFAEGTTSPVSPAFPVTVTAERTVELKVKVPVSELLLRFTLDKFGRLPCVKDVMPIVLSTIVTKLLFGVTSIDEILPVPEFAIVKEVRFTSALMSTAVKTPLDISNVVSVGLLLTSNVASNGELPALIVARLGKAGGDKFVSPAFVESVNVVNAGRLSIWVDVIVLKYDPDNDNEVSAG